MNHWLIARQMPDGRWLGNGINRPPSDTAPSAIPHRRGRLEVHPLPGRKNEITDSLRRSRQWLLAANPKSAEERGLRLMGPRVDRCAARSCGGRNGKRFVTGRKQAAAGSRSAATEPMPRDGTLLYALAHCGHARDGQGVPQRRGVPARDAVSGRCLAVKTHFFSTAAVLSKAAFPFGRPQWISSAGTSWATLAIAQTLRDAAGR